MLDRFGREISYLRISVTDRCNLRCCYCMPVEGVPPKLHNNILRYEQIEQIVREAVKSGITKVRITGGEPLVRKNIESLIESLSKLEGIKHLAMTTNGSLLAEKVEILKKAGLNSINISLDTLDTGKYELLTRGGNIKYTFEGIAAAVNAGFPVKINMVVIPDFNDKEVFLMRRFCEDTGAKLQLINHFSLHNSKSDNYEYDRPPKCIRCNRIRLLSDGYFKPCLHSDIEYKVDFNDITGSLRKTILSKPAEGHICSNKPMSEIGG